VVVDTLVDLPIQLPPVVASVAMLVTFGRRGPLGPCLTDAGIEFAFTQIAVIMAHIRLLRAQ